MDTNQVNISNAETFSDLDEALQARLESATGDAESYATIRTRALTHLNEAAASGRPEVEAATLAMVARSFTLASIQFEERVAPHLPKVPGIKNKTKTTLLHEPLQGINKALAKAAKNDKYKGIFAERKISWDKDSKSYCVKQVAAQTEDEVAADALRRAENAIAKCRNDDDTIAALLAAIDALTNKVESADQLLK